MPLIQKNDVNQIFAEQAPSIDKPATFANYPRGWDESRKNNGKPLIKQFNYLQQRTDQNVLYIHQNGAGLPYDENIEYAEGAPVVKDGELVQKVGGDWKKVSADKTSQILDDSGKTQQEINNIQKRKTVHVLDFGMKMDGSDETQKLNEIIATLDNCKLIIGGGNLTLSKTDLYASDFPNNDQPCVPILDKTRFVIEIDRDCIIFVNEHAQGAFEMMRCMGSHVINHGSIRGAGNFPPIDGITGRSEKGVAGGGYGTSGFWGYRKNNSLDTSANTSGGFGGLYPQFGGGTASTWGVWNGGFIGNQGFGVLIHNGCFMCGVVGSGESTGFNGGGYHIGFNGDYSPTNLGYPDSKHCFIKNTNAHGNYSANIAYMACENALIDNNNSYSAGHPDFSIDHTSIDPGYGITAIGSIFSIAKECKVQRNNVYDCARKGLDVHGGNKISMLNNIVERCNVGGIFAAWSSDEIPVTGTIIKDNIVRECGFVSRANIINSVGGIFIQSRIGAQENDAIVEDNIIDSCFAYYAALTVRLGKNSSIKRNKVFGLHPRASENDWLFSGIEAGGSSASLTANDSIITENEVGLNSSMTRGISTRYGSGLVKNNTIKIPADSLSAIGVYHQGTSASMFDYLDNYVECASGLAYSINQTNGATERNTFKLLGAGAAGNTKNTTLKKATQVLFGSVLITFNQTDTPTFSITTGGDFISGVSASEYGAQVNLTNIRATDYLVSSVNNVSAEGFKSATDLPLGYSYIRATGLTSTIVGIKETQVSTSHSSTANTKSGSIRVDLFISR